MDSDQKKLLEEKSGVWGGIYPNGNNEEDCEYFSMMIFGIFKTDICLVLISLGPYKWLPKFQLKKKLKDYPSPQISKGSKPLGSRCSDDFQNTNEVLFGREEESSRCHPGQATWLWLQVSDDPKGIRGITPMPTNMFISQTGFHCWIFAVFKD